MHFIGTFELIFSKYGKKLSVYRRRRRLLLLSLQRTVSVVWAVVNNWLLLKCGSDQLIRALRTQVFHTSKSASLIYTIISKLYHFMTSSDRLTMPTMNFHFWKYLKSNQCQICQLLLKLCVLQYCCALSGRGVAKAGGPGGPGTPNPIPLEIIKEKTCMH